jgi:tetratricopeptide (TPR) repeat protein
VKKTSPGRRSTGQAQSKRPAGSRGLFRPQLSAGHDIPATLFVIACLLVIAVGGWSLARGVRQTEGPRLRFDPDGIFQKVRDLAEQVIGEDWFGDQRDGRRALARGRALLQKASYAEALREFDKAVETSPNPYKAHFWRGRVLVKMGREAEAVAAFEACIAGNPRYSYAYDNLGWIYLRRGDYETSLAYLDQSLGLRPDNAWAYYNRGRVHFQLGQRDKALQDAEAACRLGSAEACAILQGNEGKPGS